MATVGIAVCKLTAGSITGGPSLLSSVLPSAPIATSGITSSGSSQQSAAAVIAAADAAVAFWHIRSAGGAVWVKFGANPVAAAGDGYLIPDGGSGEFSAVNGDKVAVINA